MRFRFDDDQLAMRDAVAVFCADRLDLAEVAAREGQPAADTTWSGLADLGILGMLVDGPRGDIGLVEATLVFEELGAHLVSGPVLWSTVGAGLVSGVDSGAVRAAGVVVDDAAGLPVVVEHAAESDVVLLLRGDRLELCRIDALPSPAAGAPFDPLTPISVFGSLPSGDVVAEGDIVVELRRSGTVLAAAMLVGAAQAALEVAQGYALEREQFGRQIGSFQAVKHLLADMFVRVELARAATYAAAAIAAGKGDGDPDVAAGSAKLLAGDAGITNGRVAVQVLGGMGFTWDMLPHYFLKRSYVLDELFGTSSWHARRVGAAVAQAHREIEEN